MELLIHTSLRCPTIRWSRLEIQPGLPGVNVLPGRKVSRSAQSRYDGHIEALTSLSYP